MTPVKISSGTVHRLPTDVKSALMSNTASMKTWESLTPLARNEWICWIISVKQLETRKQHIKRAVTELQQGKRRPCCWMGCIHRTDKEISPSIRGILSKRNKLK